MSVGPYGETTSASAATATSASPKATSALRTEANPRIDVRVHQIDGEIAQHEQTADEEHRTLHDRIVALEHGPEEQAPDARQGEHFFGDDRAAEQIADLHAGDGDQRDEA